VTIQTGYDEGPDEDELDDEVVFGVELYYNQYTKSGIMCRVRRNEEWIGLIRLKNVREFNWLEKRLSGVLRPKEEEENDSDNKTTEGDG